MDAQIQATIRQQLEARRGRLQDVIPAAADPARMEQPVQWTMT